MKKLTAAILLTLPMVSTATFAANQDDVCKAKEYTMGLRYQQQSGEIMALQMQTYHFATEQFKNIMRGLQTKKKPAVVLDLDETILDNSALLARDMNSCHDYTSWDTWSDWEKKGHPTLIPGSKAFLDYVNKQGVKIFYVSDRYQKNKADTLNTLKELGLPQVSSDNVLLYTGSKEKRRTAIRKDYKIIMLFGDSLPDLDSIFKNKKSTQDQRKLVAEKAHHFGRDWIVLPNAAYGSWTHAKLKAWNETSPK